MKSIERRIRKIAAGKVRVVITGKNRNRGGFTIIRSSTKDGEPFEERQFAATKKGALNNMLVRIKSLEVWKIEPTKPNPKAGGPVLNRWGKKLL